MYLKSYFGWYWMIDIRAYCNHQLLREQTRLISWDVNRTADGSSRTHTRAIQSGCRILHVCAAAVCLEMCNRRAQNRARRVIHFVVSHNFEVTVRPEGRGADNLAPNNAKCACTPFDALIMNAFTRRVECGYSAAAAARALAAFAIRPRAATLCFAAAGRPILIRCSRRARGRGLFWPTFDLKFQIPWLK